MISCVISIAYIGKGRRIIEMYTLTPHNYRCTYILMHWLQLSICCLFPTAFSHTFYSHQKFLQVFLFAQKKTLQSLTYTLHRLNGKNKVKNKIKKNIKLHTKGTFTYCKKSMKKELSKVRFNSQIGSVQGVNWKQINYYS